MNAPDLFAGMPAPEMTAYGLSSPRDPATSDAAAIAHAASGRLSRNVRIVVKLVRQNPGLTAVELHCRQVEKGMDLTRTEISRRLPDAEKRGLVRKGPARKGPARKCSYPPFHSMVTWEPVGNNQKELGNVNGEAVV